MAKLRFSPAARIAKTADGLLLTSDLGTFQLHGADVRIFASRVEPLLDGSRDAEAVASALPAYSRASVISFLGLLRQKGLVEEVAEDAGILPACRVPQDRFFHSWQHADAGGRLAAARVLLVGAESWGIAAALELAAAGVGAIHVLDQGKVGVEDLLAIRAFGPPDLGQERREALARRLVPLGCVTTPAPLVVKKGKLLGVDGSYALVLAALPADHLNALLATARFAHQAGIPALFGHLDGFEAWLGPATLPGGGPCWNCLRLRRLALAPSPPAAHQLDAALLAAAPAPRAHALLGPMPGQVGLSLAMEALKLLTGYLPSTLVGRVHVHNLVTHELELHSLVPMPWCEVCGGAAALLAKALPAGSSPGSAPPAMRLDQVVDVAGLRQLLGGWVDAKVGVLRALTSGGEPPGVLPQTASAMVANYSEGALLPAPLDQIGSGKGVDSLSAHIGAVGEAIERYSAARYRRDQLKLASYNELRGDKLDPLRLCLYSEEQYREKGFPFPRFSPKKPIHWVQGFWLDGGGPVWVPALLAYFNYLTVGDEPYFCQVSSNALAAGGSLEDAALRATLELIERDAAMIVWLCRRAVPRVELDASLDAGGHEVVRRLEQSGIAIELYLFDVGIGIPTMFCLGFGDGGRAPGVMVSLSTHTDPRKAALKALLEMAHVTPYLASIMHTMPIPASFENVHTLEDHALYYVPPARAAAFDFLRRGPLPPIRLGDLPSAGEPTVEQVAGRLRAAGLRVAIVDTTSPDVALSPIRVARAVGVDMQPIHFGTRLRRLGNPRLHQFLAGGKLNPDPHPIA